METLLGDRDRQAGCRVRNRPSRASRRARPLGTTTDNVGPPPSGGGQKRQNRRSERYSVRQAWRRFSTLKRAHSCGWNLAYGATGVPVKIADGIAHFSGLTLCGLVWACPTCSPNIRQKRAEEINDALGVAVARGLSVLFLTLTCRHHRGQPLAGLLEAQEAAFRRFIQSKPYRRLVKGRGLGFIQQREVTYGEANGWHPHRHLAVVLEGHLDDDGIAIIRRDLWLAWETALRAEGLSAEEAWGLDLRAGDSDGLAGYMLKVRGSDQDLAMEMLRGDLKQGRSGRRTPEQILRGAADGDVHDLALWREYEQATAGRKMTTWSKGLRKELALPEEELTDEELVQLDVGGTTLATLGAGAWAVVREASPGGADLLRAAEDGTWRAYLDDLLGPGVGWHPGPACVGP